MIDIFPIHASIIFGVVAFAATRGLRSFPFILSSMYAAFFITSEIIYQLVATVEFQIVTAVIFSSILFNFCINTKRRLYIDLFCLSMIFAIINYSLLYFSYIALSGDAYGAATHLCVVARVILSIADIVLLIGVINGCSSDRVYARLFSFIGNGILRGFLFVQASQADEGQPRQTKAQKEHTLDG